MLSYNCLMSLSEHGMRLDELARAAGVATTTVRLYRNKGLLHPPRLVGRTGYFDESHVTRLRLIGQLQEEGFSLAGIGRLLETWAEGKDLAALVGVEKQLDALLTHRNEVELDAVELAQRFPEGMLTADLVVRAIDLGLVVPVEDGRFRVPDARFLDTGAALVELGIPASVVLDEWEALSGLTDEMARRFVALFEKQLLPKGWRKGLDGERAAELAGTLARLRALANTVVLASLDASVSRVGSRRLAALLPDG